MMRPQNNKQKIQPTIPPPRALTTEGTGAHPWGTRQISHGIQEPCPNTLGKHLQPAKPTTPYISSAATTPASPSKPDIINPGTLASEEEVPDLTEAVVIKAILDLISRTTKENEQHSYSKH